MIAQSMWEEFVRKATALSEKKSDLMSLLTEALFKANSCKEALENSWNNLTALIRLVKAWVSGKYNAIPWSSIVLGVAALIYFVTPVDAIPDFIPIIGYVDDITILGIAINAMGKDFTAFIEWEKSENGEAVAC